SGKRSIFYDNIVMDNYSVNIYICNESDAIVTRNLIYSHDPDVRDLYNNGDQNPHDSKSFRWLRPEGVMTADEYHPVGFKNALIVNNIVINCRRGITHYGMKDGSGLKNVLIAHNTIILPSNESSEKYIGIKIPYNNGNNYKVEVSDNIIASVNANSLLLFVDAGLANKNDYLNSLTFRNNIWYNSRNPKVFNIGPIEASLYARTLKEWGEIYKKEKNEFNDQFVDPQLVYPQELSAQAGLLSNNTPAIDAGIPVEGLTTDYNNNIRSTVSPTIGALEFIQKSEDR
ncbi:MAG: hypothetical protein ABH865_08300, partial [Candidatus Omnitrophota bacterium]